MELTIEREQLLKALQAVIGVVERKQTLPILSHVLLKTRNSQLTLTGTDLEVELTAMTSLENEVSEHQMTVPARKFLDICRSLPDQSSITLTHKDQKLIIYSGRSRFNLSTLTAEDFPKCEDSPGHTEFNISQSIFRKTIERTYFAMAQEDVRYYLNGMLLEVVKNDIRLVATNGHRLAFNSISHNNLHDQVAKVIIPRKAVVELLRILTNDEGEAAVTLSDNMVKVISDDVTMIAKLIDSRYPDYHKAIPRDGDKVLIIDKEPLRQVLSRAAILSNEKVRGVRVQLRENLLKVTAANTEQEEAEEELPIEYTQENLDIGFNVNYLLDVLGAIPTDQVKLTFSDNNSSILIEQLDQKTSDAFVVMPLRL